VTTADRLLEVLNLFTRERPDWSVEEAALAIETPTSTTYRYFKGLTKSGLLGTFGGGRYILGPAIIRYDRQLRLTDPLVLAARHQMDLIADTVAGRGVVFLCRLFDDQVMCVSQASVGDLPFAISYERGRLMPLFAGSASRVILAHLPVKKIRLLYRHHPEQFSRYKIGANWPTVRDELKAIREKGGFTTVGEIDPGMRGISVPIVLAETVIGSLTVAGPKQGFGNSAVGALLDDLGQAVTKITRELYRATVPNA
jgi:DNA-binding IclR family transcriptional regulator